LDLLSFLQFGSKVLAVNMAEGPEAETSDAQVKLVKVQTWDVAGVSICPLAWMQRE